MKPKLSIILIIMASTATLLSFQNCANSNFAQNDVASMNKPESSNSGEREIPADNADGRDPARNACGDLGKNAQWILISALLDGKALVLPDNYKFAFAVHKTPQPKDRLCAGDCGVTYKQNVHSYSGSLEAEYSCRWDEARAAYVNTFRNDQTAADRADKLASGSPDKVTDGIVVSHLKGQFTIQYTRDFSVMTLTFSNGDVMSFAHHNNAIFF